MNIYESNETNFERNGYGFLNDCISANVKETLNGDYTLTLEYPLNAKLSEYLVEENIIKTNVGNDNYQLFRIKRVIKNFETIQVTALHITYDLLDNFLLNTAPTNQNCNAFGTWILNNTNFQHNFTFYSDITNTKSARYVRKNPIEAIMGNEDNSMVNLFGGEVERDNFNIKMLSHRGNNNNVKLLFGKNIEDIKITIDITSLYTRILPLGFDGLMIPEKYVDSPIIGDYITPKIGKVEFSNIKYDPEDEEAYHDIEDAYTALRNGARELFNQGIDKPSINIKINWVELSKTEQYKNQYQALERVNIGDTITASILGLEYTTKVIQTTYNVLTDSIDKFEIGTVQSNISRTINQQQKEFEKINVSSILQSATDNATKLITNAMGGYVYKTNEELFIMDTDDPQTAKKVWRWNLNGLGYSKNGINGPYELAMTQDGSINASMITSGKINTNLIEGYDSLELQVNKLNQIEYDVEETKEEEEYPVEIYDALEKDMVSIEFDGKTYQETRSGKNLLNTTNLSTATNNGITFTPVYNGKDLQYINVNGTATANASYRIIKPNLPSGDLILNGCLGGSNTTYFIEYSNMVNKAYASYNGDVNMSKFDYTTYPDTSLILQVRKNITMNNVKMYPMIRLANVTDNNYEPYGAMPSPDYPSEVQNVKGVTNLIPNDIEITADYTYYPDGSFNPNTNYISMRYIAVKPNTTYVYSDDTDKIKYTSVRIMEFTNSKGWIKRGDAISNSKNNVIFKTGSTTYYISICVYTSSKSSLNDISIYQLEPGTTTHNHVPYGTWLEQTSRGKNLFDMNTIVNGKAWNWASGFSNRATGYAIVKPNTTYTINISNIKLGGSPKIYWTEKTDYASPSNIGTSQSTNNESATWTLTTTTTTGAIAIQFMSANGTTISVNDYKDIKVMINEDTGVIPNEPYQTNIVKLLTQDNEEILTESGEALASTERAFINMNKPNLFDNSNITNGYFHNTTLVANAEWGYYETNIFKPGITYTNASSTRMILDFYNGDTKISVLDHRSGLFTIPANTTKVYVSILLVNKDIQTIYEGTENTPYYELCAIGNVKDTFKDGVITKRIGKVVLDGSDDESWTYSGYSLFIPSLNKTNNSLCTHFINSGNVWKSADETFRGKYSTDNDVNYWKFMPTDKSITNATQWRTWLSNNPITVYYELSTPYTIIVPYNKLPLLKGYNYIELVDEVMNK